MKDTHLKYLQRGLKARILGNRLEIKKNSRVKIYKVFEAILNDERFYSTLDFRRQWIGYASKRIAKFIDTITQDEWGNERLLEDRIDLFLVGWFLAHFGKQLIFIDDDTVKESLSVNINGANETSEDDEEDDFEIDGEHDFNDYLVSDKTTIDTSSRINLDTSSMPMAMKEFAEAEYDITTEIKYLKSIDKSIVNLALELGRTGMSTFSMSTSSQFSRSSHSDISGVTIGADLNALLPIETALLGDSVTENVFYRKFVEKRLQVLASASSSPEGKKQNGPIILCVDTSSSMDGEPAEMAKQLALAVAIVAQRSHRTLCLINYSYSLSYFVLTNIKRQRNALLGFLAQSYGGGNDENLLFKFIFRSLLKGRKYSHLKNKLVGADLLVVSDYMWGWLSKNVVKDIDKAISNGMRIYSLKIGDFEIRFDEKMLDVMSGHKYIERCYENYKYVGGKCIKEKYK